MCNQRKASPHTTKNQHTDILMYLFLCVTGRLGIRWLEVCFSGTGGDLGRDAQPLNTTNRPSLFGHPGGADRRPAVVSSQQRRNFPCRLQRSISTQTSTSDWTLPSKNHPISTKIEALTTSLELPYVFTTYHHHFAHFSTSPISRRETNLKRAVSCTALRLLSFQTAAVDAKINCPFPSLPGLQASTTPPPPPRFHALQPKPAQRRSARRPG